MNQRASHFVLGSSSVPYSSIYAKDFVPRQPNKQQAQTQNPFRGSSLQHGNQNSSFQTTNKALMQNWGQVQHAKLDPKKLQNLRGHHFTLGNYNPTSVNTSHKLFYDRKQLNNDASSKQEESKIKMRMHNHDFKEQNWTNFQSSYAKEFVSHDGNEQNTHNIVKHEGSNAIVLGNHKIPMISTNALQYTEKKVQNQQGQKTSLQQTSALVLGSNQSQEPMQTMNQHYFTAKQITPNTLPEATMKQLRQTHFNLGTMKQTYATESNLYQQLNSLNSGVSHVKQEQGNFEVPRYESGTWVDKEAKFNSQTTNRQQFPTREVEPYKKYETKVKGGFELGSFRNTYETEFKKNFAQKDPKDSRAPNAKKNDNLVIGLDKGSYVSQQKANYKTRDLNEARTDNKAIKAMNTEDHFKIGGTSSQAQLSTYQDEYRKDIQNTNKMFHNNK